MIRLLALAAGAAMVAATTRELVLRRHGIYPYPDRQPTGRANRGRVAPPTLECMCLPAWGEPAEHCPFEPICRPWVGTLL